MIEALSAGERLHPLGCTAPTLRTERLCLRAHRSEDLDARAAIYADAETTRFIGGPQGREECWARIQRYCGHWALLGWGLWAIEHSQLGLLGEAGLGRFERGLGADFDDAPEAAWILSREGAGAGYAAEAMRAIFAWHVRRFGPQRYVCVIAHENTPSLRLAERLGFVPFAERDYKGAPRLLLERLPGAAEAA